MKVKKYSKIVIIAILLQSNKEIRTMENFNPFSWFTAQYNRYQTAKQQETLKQETTESKKIAEGRKQLEEKRKSRGLQQKKESPSPFAGVSRTFQQTWNPKSISSITKNVSLKLGLGGEQRYAYLAPQEPLHTEFNLGNSDKAIPSETFAINEEDTIADIAILKNKEDEYKLALLVGKRDKDKRITDSTIYIGQLPLSLDKSDPIILINESEKNSSNIIDENGNKVILKSPNRIASNGDKLYFTQQNDDNLFECTVPKDLKDPTNKSVNMQKVKKYKGLFSTSLTVTQLAKIKGDFATKNVFFASRAPNLYKLDAQAQAKFRDEIAGAGYLLDIYQNTLIYGRLYDDREWYEVLWSKFTGKIRQFKAFITGTEGGGKQGTTVRRIGYYAKFYGAEQPTQISLDEDYEEAKMMAPVDTVIYGDVVKNYVMIPAAASEKYAVVFIGKRRGMHFAIQSKKGLLFPKMLSWYKILKHSLYADRGTTLNIAPEDTLPRKLFIVQHAKDEHYLCIVMRSHVFLMMTPLEKIDIDPNKSYNVAMSCIYKPDGGRSKKKIVASSFFAEEDYKKPQPLFLTVRNEESQDLYNKFKLLFFNDLHEIIEAQKARLKDEKNFNPTTQTWNWVLTKAEQGQEEME